MKRTGTRFRKDRADTHYDVIVIGSGPGGLCNAALLSKLGKKVCVLEQHYTAGGYSHTYERNGYEWDVGVHYVGEVHKPFSMIRRVFDVISDSQLEWAYMDQLYDRIVIGDKTYDYLAGKEPFKKQMKEYFPTEGEAIDQYVELLGNVSKLVPRYFAGQALPKLAAVVYNKARHYMLPDYFFKSTREVLEGLTKNEELIGVLTAQWGDYGLTPKKSSFMMHAMVAKHYIAGGNYPVGGSSRIAETIIPVIKQSGGNVFTYAGVDEILVKNNRAYGVRLKKGGHEIFADQVVSNAGIYPTYQDLLPEKVAKKNGLLKNLKKVDLSASHVCIYAGFKGSAEELNIPKTNYWVYPDANHDENVDRFLASDGTDDFPLTYISFPSAKDPAWNDRFPGKSTVEIVAPTNHKWFQQWQGTTWNKRGEGYHELKEEIQNSLLETLYKHMPQLRGAIDYVELSTPLSTQWFQWNKEGEIYGIDHTVDRFQQNWLHPITPIKNLYLTGADIVTAGVGGALMGGVMSTCAMIGVLESRKVMNLIKEVYKPEARQALETESQQA
ncbi:phytoene desaturase family protein [Alkalimarinus alittae]|uniref:NAD(P)/FAD-dependent oxidoreductase n=1 Tax=Alkalimarinus alittae TaxID=2961619 RepID=A0ABY6N338_9ALTE|nr:NAD(P)/FAD-dependent oxidoreductase [Alkalimarinus alittae]UZE96516.1 NAD(P)/FAD-dependent oxidoreductase [Alkalimarinus alittae]